MTSDRSHRPGAAGLVALASLALSALACNGVAHSEEPAQRVPAAVVDESVAANPAPEKLVLAGGCFWGIQGVYQHVRGVTRAVSGYAGGSAANAHYMVVGSGLTGHAESVEITYDPKEVTLGALLQIFFSVAHDPTQLNRQGPDSGSQYRSAIFVADDAQKRVADAYVAQLGNGHVYQHPIVTRLEPLHGFYPAERYHQDYLTLNPTEPYIAYNDLPKIENLKRLFPERYRSTPVLVTAAVAAR